MKQDLIKQFNLPKYIKGKSMSEASKLIDKKFKDRNDDISVRTKEELMGRLMEAQEYVKMQRSLENNKGQMPETNGEVPEGMEQFAEGGFATTQLGAGLQKGASSEELGESIGGMADMAGGLLNSGQQIFGNTGVDVSGQQRIEETNVGMDTAKSALTGFAEGTAIGGPIVGAAYGLVKGAGSLIGGIRGNKDAEVANFRNVGKQNAAYKQSDFAYGGSMTNKYDGNQPFNSFLSKPTDSNRFAPLFSQEGSMMSSNQNNVGSNTDRGKDKKGFGDYLADAGRLAPIVGNIMALKNLKQAPNPRRERSDIRYKPNMVDEKALQNTVSGYGVNRAIFETSGGDAGAARTNILAVNLNKTKALSSAYLQSININNTKSDKEQQFNANQTKFNIGQSNLDEVDAQANAGAFNTAKSQLQQAIAGDIGAVSKEAQDRKIVQKMFGYKWNGEYYVDKKGNKISKEDAEKQVAAAKNPKQIKQGGYLKR